MGNLIFVGWVDDDGVTEQYSLHDATNTDAIDEHRAQLDDIPSGVVTVSPARLCDEHDDNLHGYDHERGEYFKLTIAGRNYDDYETAFVQGYCVAMLWANTRYETRDETDDLDMDVDPHWWQTPAANWGIDAFDRESQKSINEDCESFVRQAAMLLDQAHDLRDEYDAEQAGHDFALTRNGHGAGFWDRGLDDIGRKLTDMSKPYGSSNAWIHRDDNPNNDNLAHLD